MPYQGYLHFCHIHGIYRQERRRNIGYVLMDICREISDEESADEYPQFLGYSIGSGSLGEFIKLTFVYDS